MQRAPLRRRRAFSMRQRLILAAIAVEIPALYALARVAPYLLPLPVLWTASWWLGLRGLYSMGPRNRWHLYLGLWPFFAWWMGCVVFAALSPLALFGSFVWRHAWAACGAVSALAGLRSIWRRPRIRRIRLRFADLPAAFEGYRIVHLSDVHCGPFAPEERVARWVRRANRQRPDLVALTGDLIAHGTSHIDAVARALGGLRAPDGVVASMGNHDYFGDPERLVCALEAHGIEVLRNRSTPIARGADRIWVAGVDDTWAGHADLRRALADTEGFRLLLAHDPELFPHAAAHGVDLVLSGHTHGGQVGIPFLARRLNLARIAHELTAGLYRTGDAVLYVNRGIGTTGPPVRLGVPAEIAVLTLERGN